MKTLKQFLETIDEWNGSVNLTELKSIYESTKIQDSLLHYNTINESYRDIVENMSDDDIVILARPKKALYQNDVDKIKKQVEKKTFTLEDSVINVRKNISNGFQNKLEFVLEDGSKVLMDKGTLDILKENNINPINITNKNKIFSVISEILED